MKAIVTLSSKGQFTLPADVRTALGLKQGDRLEVSLEESGQTFTVSRVPDLEELSARISGYAKRRAPVTDVDSYYQEHRPNSAVSHP